MIKINYLAATTKNFDLSYDENDPVQSVDEKVEGENIKENHAIFNFVNFFDSGIDLTDNSLIFGDNTDYYGWMFHGANQQTPVKEFELNIKPFDSIDLTDGLTIAFNKGYSCYQIKVYFRETLKATVTADSDTNYRLPEVNKITFTENYTIDPIKIVLEEKYGTTCCPNIKGIYFGSSIDIDEIFEYDNISEMDPIGTDLPINEANFTAYIRTDFIIKGSQSINIFDNEQLFERQLLYNAEETEQDVYEFKARNKIQLGEKNKTRYNIVSPYPQDWTTQTISAANALDSSKKTLDLNFEYPDYFSTEILSPFLTPCTTRKLLQQIAWATCCGIDTTYSEKTVFVPFLAQNRTTPDIILNNEDEKILHTSVKCGTEYSKVIWEITEYNKSDTLDTLGKAIIDETQQHNYILKFDSDTPFLARRLPGEIYSGSSPFNVVLQSETLPSLDYMGYKYNAQTVSYEINTGLKGSEVLRITDQQIYPVDPSKKIAQLKKWYSANNTLTATVADKDSEIRIGKIIKIQLKKGNYFQGIITKVNRSNISDYHTVELEAHQWD